MPGMGSSRQDDSDGNELADFPGQRLPDEEARIDGRRESSHQAGVQLRDHSDADVSSNRISPEEIARLWDDLEAETGFRSYLDYLKAYEKRYPHLRKLKQQLRFMSTTAQDQSLKDEGSSDGPRHCCAIYNVYDGDDAFPKMNLQCGTSSANVILPALRQPTATATLRMVLWEALDSVPEVLHSLGLGLKIQPRFFQALLARNTDDETLDTFEEPPLTSELLVIDRYVVAIARQYYPASPDIKSVILIARVDSGHWDPKKDFNETIPFQKQATKENSGPVNRLPVWMLEYVRLLKSELEKWTESAGIAGDLSFRSLIPLLQLNASRIHKQSRLILKEFRRFEKKKGHSLEDLFRMRSSLRRLIEDSEENSEEFRNIVRGRMANDTQHSNLFEMVENELRQACLEARRWEAEIRDYLQLQTGELALNESRKSIELSNLQIGEAKRVRIFTILAFIYVPLNLVTSIFGMNIQQLNGNGQHLSIFIITAIVALALTGGSWFVIEQANSYTTWRKRSPEDKYDGKTKFPLVVRLALIVFLVSHRYTRWMFRSGAWWRIIVNHHSRLLDRIDGERSSLTASEYVSKYSHARWHTVRYFVFGSSPGKAIRWTSAT